MSESIFNPQYEILHYNFQHSPTPLVIFDLSGQLLHINPAFSTFLGAIHPDALASLNLFKHFQLSEADTQFVKTKDQSRMEIVLDLAVFALNTGIEMLSREKEFVTYTVKNINNTHYLLHIEKSISQRELNATLLEQNEQFSLALNVGNIALWDWNLIDNTLFFSDNFYTWFDYDISYVEKDASLFFSLIHSEDVERLQREINRYLQNISTEFYPEFRIRQNEVDFIWLSSSANIVRDQDSIPSRLTGILINITTQRLEQLELELERNKLNTLFKNMNTGFALCKLISSEDNIPSDAEFLFVNPSFERIMGLKASSVIGKTALEIISEIEPVWLEKFGDIAQNGGSTHFTQYSKAFKRYFDIIAYQTEPLHFAVIFSDVSEKVRAENALIQADKMNSIGQLAGGIAHDFNNHLQIIRGYTELIEEKVKTSNCGDIQQYLERIHHSVKHSSAMIKQLLVFSKEEHYEGKAMDFHLLLHQTKNILTHTINRNIPIQLLLEANSHNIVADESLLQNAIINICLNSRDALPNGGLILIMTRNITFHQPTIIGSNQLDVGTYLKCSIRDNGEGISPDDLPHVFEPFFTTKPNKGTGMGLSAAFGTLKNHQGAIDVSSEFGEWTQFDIYLKVSDDPVRYIQPKKEPAIKFFQSFNILIVDDEPIIAQVISEYLSDLGHNVTIYNNPNELLSDYNKLDIDFDLLLLDVIMPEMSGFDLLEEIIQLEPSTKAIFLSGYYNQNDIKESIRNNILDYIEKPVNLNLLNEKIQRLLQ